jgi:hypothetical protein
MIFGPRATVRLTDSELNELRQANARVGRVVHRIATQEELLTATIDALDPSLQADLLAFLDAEPSGPARPTHAPSA